MGIILINLSHYIKADNHNFINSEGGGKKRLENWGRESYSNSDKK